MQLWLISRLPLAGFLINGLFGRRFSKGLVNAVAIGSVVLSFAWVLKTILGAGDLHTRLYRALFHLDSERRAQHRTATSRWTGSPR